MADDGSFALEQLPPGRYGLKVGSDAILDSEVPRPKDWKDIPADAWKTKSRSVAARHDRGSEGRRDGRRH